VKITQSESEHAGAGHHVTVCVWYVPDESPHASNIGFVAR
jgi:hypothetical protein